ncbi:hypothetical protein [Amorphus sp. MBR-141]|jgi:hypothetical protein
MSKDERRGNKEQKKPKADPKAKGPKAGPKYMGAASDAGPFLKIPNPKQGKSK